MVYLCEWANLNGDDFMVKLKWHAIVEALSLATSIENFMHFLVDNVCKMDEEENPKFYENCFYD